VKTPNQALRLTREHVGFPVFKLPAPAGQVSFVAQTFRKCVNEFSTKRTSIFAAVIESKFVRPCDASASSPSV